MKNIITIENLTVKAGTAKSGKTYAFVEFKGSRYFIPPYLSDKKTVNMIISLDMKDNSFDIFYI